MEGLKLIEIERCKKDISDIKNQLHESQKRLGDFNRVFLLFAFNLHKHVDKFAYCSGRLAAR